VRFPNLKVAMAERRITQFMMAAVIHTSEATFSRKLSGRSVFLPHEKQRISEFFRIDPDWLFIEVRVPAAARFRPYMENAMLTPAMEAR
jgi:hypothetical protein